MRIRTVNHHGNIRWIADYLDGKNRRHRRFFKTQDQAAAFAHGITSGTKKRGRTEAAVTVIWLFDKYLHDTRTRRGPQAQKVITARLQAVYRALRDLGILHLPQLTNDALAALVDALRARGLSEHTVYDYVATFKSAMRWAVDHDLLSRQVLDGARLPAPQRQRERFLSLEEIGALLAHLKGGPLQLPAALGVYQGLRRGEVCGLRVADVELGENRLTVTASKNRDWRTIQLHPALLEYLPAPLPAREWLCLNVGGEQWSPRWLGHKFSKEVRKLGKDWHDVTFHTLRHTCASQMAASSRHTLYQIAKFLGHRTVQTTAKYAHLLPEQVRPDW